jgi:anti-sigma B factor antagonist
LRRTAYPALGLVPALLIISHPHVQGPEDTMSNPYPRVNASPQLHIDITRPAAATIRVALTGEVDLATTPDLLDRMLSVLHLQHPALLEVDLTDVSFFGCAGVNTLSCVRSAAVRAGCQLRIVHPQPFVRIVLEMTGILADVTAAPPAEESRRGPRAAAPTTPAPAVMLAA